MAVAPALQALLDDLAPSGLLPLERQPLDDLRTGAIMFAQVGAREKQPVARVVDRSIPGPAGEIPVRVYAPERGPAPVVAYFHGGGWVFMGIETHDWICRRLANATGAVVVSVEYRLAPEHPFPAAFDDCLSVTRWLAGHAAELGGDPQRLAVAGDSAGGGLAAVVALASRTDGGSPVAAQVLIYPMCDAACATASMAENAHGYLLEADTARWFWHHYLGRDGDPEDAYASVLRAPDLAALPPALVITAEYDPLRDEGEAYAERLRAAGIDSETRCYDGMIHGFVGMDALVSEADDAIAAIGTFLGATLRAS